MKCGLARKFQNRHKISLTTQYLVYILSDNTKYGILWFKLVFDKEKKKRQGEAKNI